LTAFDFSPLNLMNRIVRAIAASGRTIYDSLSDAPRLFLPDRQLESVLQAALQGLSLDYPLRTRSKVLNSKVCEALG
jgi:hypothetical protein